MIEAIRGLRLKIASNKTDWIDLYPNVEVDELSQGDVLIRIKGVYRLQGNSPETWRLEKLV